MRSVVEVRKAKRGILRGVEEHGYLPQGKGGVLLNYSSQVPMENTAGGLGSRPSHMHALLIGV